MQIEQVSKMSLNQQGGHSLLGTKANNKTKKVVVQSLIGKKSNAVALNPLAHFDQATTTTAGKQSPLFRPENNTFKGGGRGDIFSALKMFENIKKTKKRPESLPFDPSRSTTTKKDDSAILFEAVSDAAKELFGQQLTEHLSSLLRDDIFGPTEGDGGTQQRILDLLPNLELLEDSEGGDSGEFLKQLGIYGQWIESITSADMWSLEDISMKSNYEGKAYSSEVQAKLLSLRVKRKRKFNRKSTCTVKI